MVTREEVNGLMWTIITISLICAYGGLTGLVSLAREPDAKREWVQKVYFGTELKAEMDDCKITNIYAEEDQGAAGARRLKLLWKSERPLIAVKKLLTDGTADNVRIVGYAVYDVEGDGILVSDLFSCDGAAVLPPLERDKDGQIERPKNNPVVRPKHGMGGPNHGMGGPPSPPADDLPDNAPCG